MDDKLKWLLIAVGAYLLYQQYIENPPVVAATAPAGGSAPPPPAPALPSAATAAQSIAQQNLAVLSNPATQAAVLNAAQTGVGGNIRLSGPSADVSQWNFYMSMVTKIPSPNLSAYTPASIDSTNISFNNYWTILLTWAKAAASGLTGLDMLMGAKPKQLGPAVTFDMNETGW